LFVATEEDKNKAKALTADEIPEGVNVKEHDESNKEFPASPPAEL